MLEERGVVGAGAEIADADGVGVRGRLMGVEVAAVLRLRGVFAWPASTGRRRCRPWGWGLLGDFANELLERGDGGGVEVRAGDADVGVEVGDGVGEFGGVLLGPLGGADEAFFFGVPAADDDGALGLPALLEQVAEAMDGFEHGGGAGVGIDGAVDPGVAMVAGDDPVVLLGGSVPGMVPMTSQMVRRLVSCSRFMWTVTAAVPPRW